MHVLREKLRSKKWLWRYEYFSKKEGCRCLPWIITRLLDFSSTQQPLLNNPIHILNYSKKMEKNSYLVAWGLVLLLVLRKFCFCTDKVEERDWYERIENKMSSGFSLNFHSALLSVKHQTLWILNLKRRHESAFTSLTAWIFISDFFPLLTYYCKFDQSHFILNKCEQRCLFWFNRI